MLTAAYSNRARWLTAIHEAGHAEVAISLGAEVTRCTIEPPETWISGHLSASDKAVYIMAGIVAQCREDGCEVGSYFTDGVAYHREEWQACGGELERYVKGDGDGDDSAHLMRLMEEHGLDLEDVQLAVDDATDLLDDRWPEVQARARELAEAKH
jgi:hypothetical protein